MRAKVKQSGETRKEPWGNRKCDGRGCKTCPVLSEASQVTSHSTGEVHKITTSANCKSAGVIYVIQCRRCGMQYVGETGQALHDRINSHRSDIRPARKTEKSVAAHFCSSGHSATDLSVLVVWRTPPGDTILRKNRDARWIRLLKTETPNGLNLRADRL